MGMLKDSLSKVVPFVVAVLPLELSILKDIARDKSSIVSYRLIPAVLFIYTV